MLEPSRRAETVTRPSATPSADLMVPLSTVSAAAAVMGVSAVADMAAANMVPIAVKVLGRFMVDLLINHGTDGAELRSNLGNAWPCGSIARPGPAGLRSCLIEQVRRFARARSTSR